MINAFFILCGIILSVIIYFQYRQWKWKKDLSPNWNDFNAYVQHLETNMEFRDDAFNAFSDVLQDQNKLKQYEVLTQHIYPTYGKFLVNLVEFVPTTEKVKELYDVSIDYAVLEQETFTTFALALETSPPEVFEERIKRGWELFEESKVPYIRWNNLLSVVRAEIMKDGKHVQYSPTFTPSNFTKKNIKSLLKNVVKVRDINFKLELMYVDFVTQDYEDNSTSFQESLNRIMDFNQEHLTIVQQIASETSEAEKVMLPLIQYMKTRDEAFKLFLEPGISFRETMWKVNKELCLAKKHEREWLMQQFILHRDIRYVYG